MSTSLPINSVTAFLPTTEVFPEDQSQLLIKHTDVYTSQANAINLREIGQFETVELLNGQQFFNAASTQQKRFAYRKVFSIGAIAAGGTSITAHGLTGNPLNFTHIYGTCITNVVDYRPIPYASATLVTDQIQINVGVANINIVNGATAPAITSAIIVLEYLKN